MKDDAMKNASLTDANQEATDPASAPRSNRPHSIFDRLPPGPLDLDKLEEAMDDDITQSFLDVLRDAFNPIASKDGEVPANE